MGEIERSARAELRRAGDDHAPADEVAPVPRRVLASWQRSEEYGLPLETVEPVFTGTVDQQSLFYVCGVEVLRGLQETLVDEPVSLMLTDGDGVVLDRRSRDRGLLEALDRVHLAPGFHYSERNVGTNGLGLALADRAPSLVRADEHYSLSLCGYTCAAAPVLDPVTGRLEGTVNLTTWSRSSSGLLLALAQSAAASTAALMLARSTGRTPRPLPRGEVFRVETSREGAGARSLAGLSSTWAGSVDQAEAALRCGRVVLAVGERGSGRATAVGQALRRVSPRARILSARAPASQDVEAWLGLWSPEVGKPDTAVVVGDADRLPSWAARELRDLLAGARGSSAAVALTAGSLAELPEPLSALVDTVVPVAPLRERPDDVLPLAEHLARRARGRDVVITPRAARALRTHDWPGNVAELTRVVSAAAGATDTVDLAHLPSEVVSGSRRRLTRIEALEREEIVRALTRPGATVKSAAEALEMSRATIYRKIAYYEIRVGGRGAVT